MKIWKKIILGFISVILIMIVIDYNALSNNIKLMNQVERLEKSNRIELSQSSSIAYSTQRVKSNLRELFLEIRDGKKPLEIIRAKQIIEDCLPKISTSLTKLREATMNGYNLSDDDDDDDDDVYSEKEELLIIDSLNIIIPSFISSTTKILKLQQELKFNEAEILFENHTEPISRKIQESISILVNDAEEEVAKVIRQMNTQVEEAIRLGVILTLLSIILAFSIGVFISKSISNPLNKLIHSANEIGKGNLETSVKLHSNDELQSLADSFNDMAKQLKIKIDSIYKLNNELVESNNTKDTFLSIIAHDLKNPFNIIIGFSDLLNNQYQDFDEEKRKKFISIINVSAKTTYELLENLLAWARSQSGKIQIDKENINLKTILNKSIEIHAINANQKNINIFNNIVDETSIYADKSTLLIAINNIINNAIKFTPTDGKITISAKTSEDQVQLSIKDTGVGISPEIIDNLIHVKKYSSNLGTNNETGSGLGLIIINDFIKKNGGHLVIESEVGKGTEFKISLPIEQNCIISSKIMSNDNLIIT